MRVVYILPGLEWVGMEEGSAWGCYSVSFFYAPFRVDDVQEIRDKRRVHPFALSCSGFRACVRQICYFRGTAAGPVRN